MRRLTLAALAAVVLLMGCGPDAEAVGSGGFTPVAGTAPPQRATEPPAPTAGPTAEAGPTSAPASTPAAPAEPAAPLDELSARLEPLAEGFTRLTFMGGAGDGSGRLFVLEQGGTIWIVRDGARLEQPFLDIRELVGAGGNEQGLLGLAFHPGYAENGRFFVNYTDRGGDTVIARYSVSADADLADPGSAVVLLTQDQPARNHNGGQLAFGPDGYLYIGLGDGGGGGDTYGNGQNLGSWLGTILRLDVDGEGDHAGRPYGIPADNPFVGQGGARPEIWAWGLRNPWRFSFDRATGDLYIADVGQNAEEEVSFQPAGSPGGENYGWSIMEGASCFSARECDQSGLVLPVATYAHSGGAGGCSITGGYVYRGERQPQLAGTYLYADYCSGNMWALRRQGEGWENRLIGQLGINPSSFGEDDAGELYVADHRGGVIYRLIVE